MQLLHLGWGSTSLMWDLLYITAFPRIWKVMHRSLVELEEMVLRLTVTSFIYLKAEQSTCEIYPPYRTVITNETLWMDCMTWSSIVSLYYTGGSKLYLFFKKSVWWFVTSHATSVQTIFRSILQTETRRPLKC